MGFRYFKFVLTSVRENTGDVQITDIHITHNNNRVDYTDATITISGANPKSANPLVNMIDNNTATKSNSGITSNPINVIIVIDFKKTIMADGFYYVTGNDRPGRDPISWEVWISLDGTNYSLVNTTTNASITPDRNTNTQTFPLSSPACFNKGTKILCLNKQLEEEYIPIENLRRGDLVKSYKHGYRKIDLIGENKMINNPNKFNECIK